MVSPVAQAHNFDGIIPHHFNGIIMINFDGIHSFTKQKVEVARGANPLIIFERQTLPQQTDWKGNLLANRIHFKYSKHLYFVKNAPSIITVPNLREIGQKARSC